MMEFDDMRHPATASSGRDGGDSNRNVDLSKESFGEDPRTVRDDYQRQGDATGGKGSEGKNAAGSDLSLEPLPDGAALRQSAHGEAAGHEVGDLGFLTEDTPDASPGTRTTEMPHHPDLPRAQQDLPALPADGTRVQFHEHGEAWKLPDGGVAIRTCIHDGVAPTRDAERMGFERALPTGTELGAPNHERLHAQGHITGPESPYGIALGHEAINRCQRDAIEGDIRSATEQVRPGVQLHLQTEVHTDQSGLFLRAIEYELWATCAGPATDSSSAGHETLLYSRSIEVSGQPGNERVRLEPETPEWHPDTDRWLRQRES